MTEQPPSADMAEPREPTAPSVARHMTLAELREAGLGHGGFDLGYGKVRAGDLVEGGTDRWHTGQVVEVFHDGECWVQWDDEPATETVKWRFIRKVGEPPSAPPTGRVELGERSNTESSPNHCYYDVSTGWHHINPCTCDRMTPPSPAAVPDYTKRARALLDWINRCDTDAAAIRRIIDALSAVASEHQVEIERLRADLKRVAAGWEAVEQARHNLTLMLQERDARLARLQETNEELIRQFAESAWDGWIHYRDVDEARWSQLTQRQQGAWMLAMRAALTKIVEMLK